MNMIEEPKCCGACLSGAVDCNLVPGGGVWRSLARVSAEEPAAARLEGLSMVSIQLRNVFRRYCGGANALEDVSFEVQERRS
jgi:hypothetical protein